MIVEGTAATMGISAFRWRRSLDRSIPAMRRGWRALRHAVGLSGAPRLVPLDGWAHGGQAVVRARVLEGGGDDRRRSTRARSGTRWRALSRRVARLYQRYAALGVPGVEVEVRTGRTRRVALSDARGLVVAELPVARGQAARVDIRIPSQERTQSMPMFSSSSGARHLVVSDIDDTILETELTNPARRYAQLLLSDRCLRVPFDGVGELYRALTRGGEPVFYVSNSPIQLHHHLLEMFQAHDLPPGPLLLRRRGITAVGNATPERLTRHKDQALARIAHDFPDLPIVLVGDSSRQDADHYLGLAERHPGRVAAIYIRRARGPLSLGVDERALAERASDAGVEALLVDSTLEVAEHAARHGLLDRADVDAVRRACAREATHPDPVQDLVSGASA